MNRPAHKKNKRPLIINSILIAILVVLIVCIVIFSTKRHSSLPPDSTDVISLRVSMSDEAHALGERAAPGTEFRDALERHIADAPDSASKASLERFFIFLASRHGFHEEVLDLYISYIETHETSSSDLCELTEYRQVIAGSYNSNKDFYSEDSHEALRAKTCAEVLSMDSNKKSSTESDFAYARRMYFNGYLTYAADLLEQVYSADPDSEDGQSAKLLLADYYYAKADLPKYYGLVGRTKNTTEEDS